MTHRVFEVDLPMPREVKDYICKNFYINVEEYDIVRGYRADDSYFSFAKDFINGTISYKQLSKALFFGELGEQIVLKSQKAFDALLFTEYKKSLAELWHPKRMERDLIEICMGRFLLWIY